MDIHKNDLLINILLWKISAEFCWEIFFIWVQIYEIYVYISILVWMNNQECLVDFNDST